MRLLLLLTALAAWCGAAAARECYACRNAKPIAGIALSADITNRLAAFPLCTMMEKEGLIDKYKQRCTANDKGCVNIVDPKDETNRLRSCFPLSRDECKDSACYCTGELCNGAEARWASGVALALALGALLVGR